MYTVRLTEQASWLVRNTPMGVSNTDPSFDTFPYIDGQQLIDGSWERWTFGNLALAVLGYHTVAGTTPDACYTAFRDLLTTEMPEEPIPDAALRPVWDQLHAEGYIALEHMAVAETANPNAA